MKLHSIDGLTQVVYAKQRPTVLVGVVCDYLDSLFLSVPYLSSFFPAGPRSAIGRAPDSYVRGSGFDTRSGNILSFLLPLF